MCVLLHTVSMLGRKGILQIFPSISQVDEVSELKQNVVHPHFREFIVLTCKPLNNKLKSLGLSFLSFEK